MTKEERMEMLTLMQEVVKPIVDTQNELKSEIQELKKAQARTDIIIENQIDKAIKTIAEGHTIINRKLDENLDLEDRVENIEHRVSAVEFELKQA